MKKIFTSIFLAGFCMLSAQNPQKEVGTWTLMAGIHKISEKWSIPTILILQHYELYNDLQFGLLRTGIGYNITPKVKLTLGYDYLHSEHYGDIDDFSSHQNRFFQELSLTNSYSKLGVSHRYRMETSWADNDDQNGPGHRFRYRLKLSHPIYRNLYATAFEEIFISLEEPHFNQNRLEIGLGYMFNPNYKMELGYFKNDFSSKSYNRIWIGMIFNTKLYRNN